MQNIAMPGIVMLATDIPVLARHRESVELPV
jgi:hypothetical protein